MRSTTAEPQRDTADDEDGIILSPEEEAEVERMIEETDEDLRLGRTISWEQFLAERSRGPTSSRIPPLAR